MILQALEYETGKASFIRMIPVDMGLLVEDHMNSNIKSETGCKTYLIIDVCWK